MSKKQESKMAFISLHLVTFIFLLSAIESIASDKVPRISVQTYHQGTVMKIYLSPGRSSVVDFPCQVTKASGGTGGDLHVTLATSIGNEVDLALDSSVSHSTSLIVRCKENVFVFDVIPSKVNHQNYIKIKQSRGAIKYYSESGDQAEKISGEVIGRHESQKGKNNQYDLSKLEKIGSGKILKGCESLEKREGKR
jgi:hypothetical protein